jgi:hypothetical protein
LGRGIDSVKDYNLKQSIIIVVAGCAFLWICLYLLTPFLVGNGRGKTATTHLEERQLADAIASYASVFQSYPTGENAAVIRILAGENPQHVKFLNLETNSTNQAGQFVDLWNTPYKISFNSTNSFSIISAGENRLFGDADDIVFDSSSNPPVKP